MSNKPELIEINKSIIQRIVSNGRITIPNEMREIYGLKDGDLMEVLVIGFYRNDGNSYQPNKQQLPARKQQVSERKQ